MYALIADTDERYTYRRLIPSCCNGQAPSLPTSHDHLTCHSAGCSKASSNPIDHRLTPTGGSLNISRILLLLFIALSRLTLTHTSVRCQPLFAIILYILTVLPDNKSLVLERSSACCKHQYTHYKTSNYRYNPKCYVECSNLLHSLICFLHTHMLLSISLYQFSDMVSISCDIASYNLKLELVYFTLHPARDKITVFRIIIFVYKKEYQYASNNK